VAAILTAAAAKERDTRLARLADGEITAAIASFEEIVTRYRGVAPSQRTAFYTGHSDRYGVLELPARQVAQVVAVDADNARRVSDAVTATSTALTSATAAFTTDDIGRTVIGEGFPLGVTIATRSSATAVVLSAATTATATGVVATIGTPVTVDQIDEAPGRIDHLMRAAIEMRFNGGDPPIPYGDIHARAAIRQVGIGDQQIEHVGLSLQRSPLMNGFIKARG
jgi:hypothetical protein